METLLEDVLNPYDFIVHHNELQLCKVAGKHCTLVTQMEDFSVVDALEKNY